MNSDDLLWTERLERKFDLIQADLRDIKRSQAHQAELFDRRFRQIEASVGDHEARLRQNTEGVTQLKVKSYVSSGGSWLMSIAALLKAYLGE